MIKGMTGFGSSQFSKGGAKAIVEIKTLNHRYFDISYYLPIGFSSIENKVREIVRGEIERGRISISVKFMQKPAQQVSLNKDVVEKYVRYAKQLERSYKVNNNLSTADLMKMPGVFEVRENLMEADEVWPLLEKSLRKALKHVVVMRRAEGRSLAADVNDKIKRMAGQIKTIQRRGAVILKEKKKKLTSEEFASFQKGADINEEISRLLHYIDEIKKLLRIAASSGKKLDFIAQEMQRETNTIGSKVQDNTVTNAVIALKSKIEKIREQAQNIE